MRIEGEAPQDDPGPEETGADGQQQDLEHSSLDEVELERIEHRPPIGPLTLVGATAYR
jgi:hypothetical protein